MKFVRAIWKLLVGIKDVLVLIFMLLFFDILYAALSARPAPVKDGVLTLDLKGSVVEQPASRVSDFASGRRPANTACATSSPRSTRPRATAGSRPSRSISTVSRAAAKPRCRPVRCDPRRARVGQAGDRLCGRLYQRQLPAGLRRVRSLAQSARRGAGYRARRLEPLFQGPARQARRDRQRLSRRHLQIGGRAVHAQRHVARSARELPGARPGGARGWRQSVHRARPKANIDLFLKRYARGGRRRRRRHGNGRAQGRPGRQDRRPPRVRSPPRRARWRG